MLPRIYFSILFVFIKRCIYDSYLIDADKIMANSAQTFPVRVSSASGTKCEFTCDILMPAIDFLPVFICQFRLSGCIFLVPG